VLTPLSPRRQLWGWLLVVVGLPLITCVCANLRGTSACRACCCCTSCWRWSSPSSAASLPAGVAVLGGFLLANWYFTPPFHH
jgi:two-component system sensor histidine kinase KdpD